VEKVRIASASLSSPPGATFHRSLSPSSPSPVEISPRYGRTHSLFSTIPSYSLRVSLTLPIVRSVTALPYSFTVFDVETTGLSAKSGDRIVEIAGVRIEGGEMKEDVAFMSLVNPEREISWEAGSVNRISNSEVKSAPKIDQVLPKFLTFAEGSFLIAHNAEFDLGFLESEKEMCWGYIDIPECFCTMQFSRSVFPAEFRHNLDIVAARLGLKETGVRHRALPDVLLTGKVFLELLKRSNTKSLEELRQKASVRVAA